MENSHPAGKGRNNALTVHKVSARANYGQKIDVPPLEADAEIVSGRVEFACSDTLKGLQLHTTDGYEIARTPRPVTASASLLPGITFVVLLEGELNFALDGHEWRISSNEGAVVFAYNLLHKTQFNKYFCKNQRVRKVALTLDHALLKQLQGQQPLAGALSAFTSNPQAFWQSPARQPLQQSAEHLISHDENTSNLIRHVRGLEFLAQALDVLSEGYPASAPSIPGHATAQSERIREHIDQTLARPQAVFKLPRCASELNMSVSTLQRLFKSAYGQTVYEYVKVRRLMAARDALVNGRLSIGEAAYLAGYKHTSNFALAFKQTFGVPPGAIMDC